mmetsp:Transcript_29499/g.57843  ORF Transcript_29499/g.57843 Transcript_29499/m.57843 type:complete len:514 (-) Transcript_29499:143-1684(-)|eukprot:CAMPEP_0172732806 /NCGR_PEP_ID=MMETSP1074-20121228/105366_1 /TAXON_ID=2916 /ORGANISM="Ceratium fusus, Strain PA161109" /LENGTH=513 /DNA_ID=CAMNT_0013561183 /DNA_START=62 /DNA_END=1603 /DNA_ORIENTATION=+
MKTCIFFVLASKTAAEFIWGASTAAWQIEGYTQADGRLPSIWDEFARPIYGHVAGKATGDPADKDYVFYKDKTIPLLQGLGVKYYRMSISWTRILHSQTKDNPGGVLNKAGLAHYAQVISALKGAGIEPVITLWHWDTPLELETKYGSWLDKTHMPLFFEAYAGVVFSNFGKFCTHWITLNEPHTPLRLGYSNQWHAPGRCSDRKACKYGDSATEPYTAAHTMLLSHGRAVKVFRELNLDGVIGLSLSGDYCEPYSNSKLDKLAAEHCMEWQVAFFFDPIFFGDYPKSMRKIIGKRLPKFTDEEVKLVKGSHTGVYFQNHYTSVYAMHSKENRKRKCGFHCDNEFAKLVKKDGQLIGKNAKGISWLYSYPPGLRKFQQWLTKRYRSGDKGIAIIVSENGWGDVDYGYNPATYAKEMFDVDRCNYYREYIGNMSLGAQYDGVNVVGYFAWSLMDNLEWAAGYTARFGLAYVDFESQKRTPKMSYHWFKNFISSLKALPHNGGLPLCPTPGANYV